MFEKAKYVNSKGTEIVFGEGNLFINSNDLRDYKWGYTEDNGKITGFKKDITPKTIPIIIHCQSKEDGIRIKNEIFEAFEMDVVTGTMGKVIVNGYYLPCYVIESKKNNYLFRDGYLELTVKLVSETGYWCQEEEKIFHAAPQEIDYVQKEEQAEEIIEGIENIPSFPFDFPFGFKQKKVKKLGKKYMFGFPFDFKKNFNANRFTNNHYAPCEFKMYIFGACNDPAIYINSHLYEVKTTLSDGDYLVIDSREQTITKHGVNGDETNLFNFRNKQSDIFKKIDPGKVSIRWAATFTFKIVLLKERSEPPWK